MKLFNRKKEILENPWDKYYPKNQRTVEVPEMSLFEYLDKSAFSRPHLTAINYFGVKFSYKELLEKIDLCAKSLVSSGVRKNDVVTICMPNTPEAVIMFYAVNKIGAVSNLIHPLSSKEEIKESLLATNSVFLQLINLNFDKVKDVIAETNVYKTVVMSPKESMPPLLSLGYYLTKDIKVNFESDENFLSWNEFMDRGKTYSKDVIVHRTKDDDTIYLHSGGTTGTPKNIVLTNGNINAIMEQAKIIFPSLGPGDNFLSILPIFHCFGLVVCVIAPLCLGATCTLVPQFDAKRFDKLIKKNKPTVLLGVPTLYEALVSNPYMMNYDMSYIKYVISGGDSLTVAKNEELNKWLEKHECSARVMQGYGMTETTGPASIGSHNSDKLGSVGIPLPGNKIKIVNPETKEEVNTKEIGEICISGPILMSRYLNNEEETNNMINVDREGIRWVHTGDLGYMDEDGVTFYVQRLKRMLIVSGYNVYPSHLENTIMKHEAVKQCGIIGVPHPYKVQVPVAYIILNEKFEETQETIDNIKKYCEEHLAKYMIPKKFIIKKELPKTMIGKVDYKELEKMYNGEK